MNHTARQRYADTMVSLQSRKQVVFCNRNFSSKMECKRAQRYSQLHSKPSHAVQAQSGSGQQAARLEKEAQDWAALKEEKTKLKDQLSRQVLAGNRAESCTKIR